MPMQEEAKLAKQKAAEAEAAKAAEEKAAAEAAEKEDEVGLTNKCPVTHLA